MVFNVQFYIKCIVLKIFAQLYRKMCATLNYSAYIASAVK